MYGVALDNAGNYLLLGGSGDEYTYSATNSAGDSSDVWVSYLVVLDPQVSINSKTKKYSKKSTLINSKKKHQGNTLYENVYGDQEGNNAGEYLAVDPNNGDVMVFVDSDTLGGAMGFLKLTPSGSPPTVGPPTTPTPSTTTTPKKCFDKWSKKKCKKQKKKGKCSKKKVAKKCKDTCNKC